MSRLKKILTSFKFWIAMVVLPFALIGCAGLFIDSDPDFVSDQFVMRDTVTVALEKQTTVSYLRAGDPDGQRVIFVHGTPGDAASNWYNMLRDVPEGFEFIAVDRPGFGFTRPKGDVVELEAQAAALAPLFETRNGRKTILAGHSLGGPIVVAAAANYPDQVGGILVLAGALDPDLENVRFIQYVGNTPPLSWLLPRVLRNANRELIYLEGELRLLEPRLPTVRQPVTIIHGTLDKLVPYDNVLFMQDHMTGTAMLEVIRLEGMNHFLQWRKQPVIMEAVISMAKMLSDPAQERAARTVLSAD